MIHRRCAYDFQFQCPQCIRPITEVINIENLPIPLDVLRYTVTVNHRFVVVLLRSRRPFRTKIFLFFIVPFVYLTLRTISFDLVLVPCYLTLPKGKANKI
jgi:hypothetical protein